MFTPRHELEFKFAVGILLTYALPGTQHIPGLSEEALTQKRKRGKRQKA
jgi:hypothetical protein